MWLLEQRIHNALKAMSPEQRNLATVTIEEKFSAGNIRQDINGTAVVSVTGILAKKRSWMMYFYGGTLYPDIIEAVQSADRSEDINDIVIAMNSPGGNVDGLFETMDVLGATTKPIKTVVSGMAASAAFGIAASTGETQATNRGDMFGSVGVAIDTMVFPEDVSISSTKAPKKRPDLTTEEGKAVVREELDAIHDVFVEGIAKGRSAATGKQITSKTINETYGQGAVVLARDALARGMIDSVNESQGQTKTAATRPAAAAEKESKMDLAKLKAEHPSVYADAVKIGVAQGVTQERDRVTAHLIYGESCKAMSKAVEAVKGGEGMTETLKAEYATAGLNNKSIDDRDKEDPGASNTPPEDPNADEGDVVADLVVKKMGLEGVL